MPSLTSPATPILTRGDLAANVEAFALHIQAENLTPATRRTYLASLARMGDYLDARGMPTDVAAIRREHLEAFMNSSPGASGTSTSTAS